MVDMETNEERFFEPLTGREQEILTYLANGYSNQEIADQLYLAEKTIRWYNTQIYSKLGVRNRKAAAKRAAELGLLAPSLTNATKHKLPVQVTPFVGRKRELAKINRLLTDTNTRLVTILAPGGMGKTRLSVEVASTQLAHYPDGVFFVPLAPLNEANDVFLTIAEVVGFTFHGPVTPQEQLLAFLKNRKMLLILDNFEHVLGAASYVDDILRSAPDLRILVTSRERLDLQSEIVYILRGMDFPLLERLTDLAGYDAVKLFMQAARKVRPDFELQPDDLAPLTQICRLTAGMPLALELAAGWLDTFALEHIAAEIQTGLDIFETDLRDLPDRHRSIRATFDRTWGRLAEADQQVFMRLSVFRGGFNFEAAVAVAQANRRGLRRLSHKALLEVSDNGRYSMHELLRQFGAEKLSQSGELPTVEAIHSAFFANFMADRQRDIRSGRQFEAVALTDPEFENLRLAWLNALQQQTWDVLPKFLDSLWFYCEVHTRSHEGLDLLQQAEIKLRSLPTTVEIELNLGCLLARLGWFYYDLGLVEQSFTASEEAIRILKPANRPADLLAALYSRQILALIHSQFDIGVRTLQEGLSLAQASKDSYWEAHFLIWHGISHVVRNDLDSSRPLIEAGLAIFKKLEDHWGMMRGATVLGDIEESQGHYQRARAYFQEALTISERFGHNFTIAANSTHLARIAFREGHSDLANRYLKISLRSFWDGGYLWASPFPLACAAQMLTAQNEWVQAVEILGTIDQHLTTVRRNDQIAHALKEELKTKLEPQPFAEAWARGQQRALSDLVVEQLSVL